MSVAPTLPEGSANRTARWVAALFAIVVVFQRFAVPGVAGIGLVGLLLIGWVLAASAADVAVLDRTRLLFWFAAMAVTAGSMLLQADLVAGADISVKSWALVAAVWFPFTFRLRDNSSAAYVAMLSYVVKIAVGLSLLTLAMVGTQVAGIPYRDWFATLVPASLQLGGFNTSAPITYGSSILRGNAWIGLEPSFVSLQLGAGLLAALFVRAKPWMLLVLLAGLIATVSGSGTILVLVGVVVMLLHRARSLLTRYALAGFATVAASTFTPFGKLLLGRSTEFQAGGDTSASLRALQPYSLVFPKWTAELPGIIFGYGPGSSQRVVTRSNIEGLLVPSPIKVFFEYGLVGGSVLAAFILFCYWAGVSRTFSFTLLFSLWTLQSGITTSALVALVLIFATLWSPRNGPPIEAVIGYPIGRKATDRQPWRPNSERTPAAKPPTAAAPRASARPLEHTVGASPASFRTTGSAAGRRFR